jgi:hypothetical protein
VRPAPCTSLSEIRLHFCCEKRRVARSGSQCVSARRTKTHPRLTPVTRSGRPSAAPAPAARRTVFSHSCASAPSCSTTSSASWQSARIAPAPANWPTSARPATAPLTTAERGRGICGSALLSSSRGALPWWTTQAESSPLPPDTLAGHIVHPKCPGPKSAVLAMGNLFRRNSKH